MMWHPSRYPPLTAFPVSYLLHIAEEAWGGETFPVWASRLSGASFTRQEFVVLNGVAWAAMCIAAALASKRPEARRMVIPPLGMIVAGNGALHAVASLWLGTYSPGAITGALLWIPLGVWALRWAAGTLSGRQFWGGCALGALVHAAVSLVALL